MEKIKTSIVRDVDARRGELIELSHRIHANPEMGFQEVKAASWLAQCLRQNGFVVEEGVGELATAFRGTYGTGKPALAILAEYDAIASLGHACGHNIIAVSAIGAAVAARAAVDRFGGRVLAIGTPAEEGGGGKILLAERGVFGDVDAAMMIHPGSYDAAATRALALRRLYVEFFGKAAHAAAKPEAGINALDAMLLAFSAINALRQQIKGTARIHGIITDGGEAVSVIPAHSAGTFVMRAEDEAYLNELQERVMNCFVGAAQATGARLEYKWRPMCYGSMRNNLTMAELFQQNMQVVGRPMPIYEPRNTFGSTDMGNLSQILPAVHAFIAVAPPDVSLHSLEFCQAAASESGDRGLLDAAKGMAMTVADLLASPEVMARVKREFQEADG